MILRHGETVTVERYTQNAHGERTKVSEHEINNFAVIPRSSNEPIDLRDQVVTTAAGVAPYGSDIRATDRIRQSSGVLWEVEGVPFDKGSPLTGWRALTKCTLRHVSG